MIPLIDQQTLKEVKEALQEQVQLYREALVRDDTFEEVKAIHQNIKALRTILETHVSTIPNVTNYS